MAHTFLNYCDNCRKLVDVLYIDDITGLELCLECLEDLYDYSETGDFEYDDDD